MSAVRHDGRARVAVVATRPPDRWDGRTAADREQPGRRGLDVEEVGVVGSTRGARGDVVRADLEQVFRACYPRVVAVAARVLGTRDEAEDVAQEVFLSFARSSVPADEAPAWLSVAAAHRALNLLRTGRRRTDRELRAVTPGAPHPGAASTTEPDVAETVVDRDERRQVREALGRLPHKQAVALVLRHSGLSYAEVATALDLSPGSVGTTVRRAESALSKELSHVPPR